MLPMQLTLVLRRIQAGMVPQSLYKETVSSAPRPVLNSRSSSHAKDRSQDHCNVSVSRYTTDHTHSSLQSWPECKRSSSSQAETHDNGGTGELLPLFRFLA